MAELNFDTQRLSADFSAAATRYEAHATLQAKVADQLMQQACHIAPSSRVLDIGCGTGALGKRAGSRWNITGLDIAPAMCRTAAPYHPVICGDMTCLPLAEGTVEGIVSSLALQWADDAKTTLSEWARVLRPGGSALIATFTHGTLQHLHKALHQATGRARSSVFITEDALKTCAVSAGFMPHHVVTTQYSETYTSLRTLMRSLQAIGATDKRRNRPRGLLTPAQLARAEAVFPGQDEWHVTIMVLRI